MKREYDEYESYAEADDDQPGRPRDLADDPALQWVIPIGRSLWAVAAGYLGLFSVLLLPAPAAVFAGVMALRAIGRDPKLSAKGRGIFGIIMGGLGTAALLAVAASNAVRR